MRIYKFIDSFVRIFRRPDTSATVSLSQWESQIFRFFCRAAANSKTDLPIEIRVAGGWVRDKLLSRPAGDIDIAIRHATGVEFAKIVSDYAEQCQQTAKEYRSKGFKGPLEYIPKDCSTTCIEPKPDNSRHLQTAAVYLDGHELDFVQLRTEDYVDAADTRVPSRVLPATPYEDACRRDFTVNALYYNLQTNVVEDWTRCGIRDLQAGILRTPLSASITIREDPLRGLRAIRFACKLGFKIDKSLRDALCDPAMHDVMLRKVSRERIGHEIIEVINSSQPVEGLQRLADYGLVKTVFGDYTFGTCDEEVEECFRRNVTNVETGIEIWTKDAGAKAFEREQRLALIFALVADEPFRVPLIILNALRASKQLERNVHTIISSSRNLSRCLQKWGKGIESTEMDDETWIDMAQILREAGERLYIATMVFCSVQMQNHKLMHYLIHKHGFNARICTEAPALDGYEIQTKLGLKKGPDVGRAKKHLIRLQLTQLRKGWLVNVHNKDAPMRIRDTQYWVDALKHTLKSIH